MRSLAMARAEIVVNTLPLSNETRSFMDAQKFARMKPGAIFINAGRGATVQEDALLHAPNQGTLRTHPRVTALPHIGSATFETRHAMAVLATSNLLQGLAGGTPGAVFDTSEA